MIAASHYQEANSRGQIVLGACRGFTWGDCCRKTVVPLERYQREFRPNRPLQGEALSA